MPNGLDTKISQTLHGGRRMSPNRHSISAVSTVKKLNTPLKASVVLLTAIILSSCATDGGDDTVTPKPSPILPTADAGGTSGSGTVVVN